MTLKHNDNTVDRNPDSKWYISKEEYPEDFFPAFCATGGTYMFDTVVARLLWRGVAFVDFLKLEDVFFSGIVREKLNITTTDIQIYRGSYDSLDLFSHETGDVIERFRALFAEF